MRTFVIYSSTASTSPNIGDLKAAGRIDILLHGILTALFASHTFREDVELHLFLMGPPNAPRHIIMKYHPENTISKKNLKKLIEMCLRKCKPGQVREVHPGVQVDDKELGEVVNTFKEQGKEVFMLDEFGEHIKSFGKEDFTNPVFILGDHDGFDKQMKKFLKKNTLRISLGKQMYFTSQAITIIHYELDSLGC
jgi:tRNA (pseudouridine54-N1)-methyltransferase